MSKPQLATLKLDQIQESPLNPRKRFDPRAMEELVASIRESGIINPVVVRPIGDDVYELAAGHRRCRAAAQAELGEVPAIIRPMDEATFIEILNVDNLQRDDLHPLEEAEGFKTLMEKVGYDIAAIAKRVGHTTNYVYDRLRLLKLIPAAQKLFGAGRFELGHAIVLARLTPSQQEHAIYGHTFGHKSQQPADGGLFTLEVRDLFDAANAAPLRDGPGLKPTSVAEFETWVNDTFRLRPEQDETLPMLFPETAEALESAATDGRKVVHITFDYRVGDEARDAKARTIGNANWKRADGQHGSKRCEHAVLGLVVAGPGRGQAFDVCIRKDKCDTHWKKERTDAQRRRNALAKAKAGDDGELKREEARERAEEAKEQRRKELTERCRRALPQMLAVAAGHVSGLPVDRVLTLLMKGDRGYGQALRLPSRKAELEAFPLEPMTPERFCRALIFTELAVQLPQNKWDSLNEWNIKGWKTYGLDLLAALEKVAPAPKPEAKPKKAAGEIAVKKVSKTLRERRADRKSRSGKKATR